MIKLTGSGYISGDAASSITSYFNFITASVNTATIYLGSSSIFDTSRTSKPLIIHSTSVISCTSSTSSALSTTAASNVKNYSRFLSIEYCRIAIKNKESFDFFFFSSLSEFCFGLGLVSSRYPSYSSKNSSMTFKANRPGFMRSTAT